MPDPAGASADPAIGSPSGSRRIAGSGSPVLSVLGSVVRRARAGLADPWRVLPLLLIVAFVCRAIWISVPNGSLIFDEAYYVNAARILLGWAVPAGDHYAGSAFGLDPNVEHPPLGKLFMALSMAVFGDSGLGWRLPSLLAGMVALGALFLIVRATGETVWLGILAVGLFAFDNLAFVHGRIGTLDMPVLAFILLGAWCALRERWVLAGVCLAIGTLVKLTALYGLLAILLLLALALFGSWRRTHRLQVGDLRPVVLLLATYGVVFIVGLGLLDARFTTYANPIDHLRHMLEYGANLHWGHGLPSVCVGNESTPWQWLTNDCQMGYLRVATSVTVGQEVVAVTPSIDFRGAMNPVLIGALPLAMLFALRAAWRTGSPLARWSVAWAAANYLPYVVLAVVSQRITYIYYFLPVVPAVAVAIAILLRRSGLPRSVAWGFVAVYLVGFAAYFPFRQIP
jgi:predicted membrane-bound dolichyl-phosphate-mannose-protein mannosyltransferase